MSFREYLIRVPFCYSVKFTKMKSKTYCFILLQNKNNFHSPFHLCRFYNFLKEHFLYFNTSISLSLLYRGIEPNVQVVSFHRWIWYGTFLCLCDDGDRLPIIIILWACWLNWRGLRYMFWRCKLRLTNFVERALRCPFEWRCSATLAILNLFLGL